MLNHSSLVSRAVGHFSLTPFFTDTALSTLFGCLWVWVARVACQSVCDLVMPNVLTLVFIRSLECQPDLREQPLWFEQIRWVVDYHRLIFLERDYNTLQFTFLVKTFKIMVYFIINVSKICQQQTRAFTIGRNWGLDWLLPLLWIVGGMWGNGKCLRRGWSSWKNHFKNAKGRPLFSYLSNVSYFFKVHVLTKLLKTTRVKFVSVECHPLVDQIVPDAITFIAFRHIKVIGAPPLETTISWRLFLNILIFICHNYPLAFYF